MIENIRLSFKGILSHKIRSFLTMLGIIIGIAAIIAIVSTIKGTNEQIKNNLIGAGNNTVKIQLSNGDTVCDFSYETPPSNVAMFTSDTKNVSTSLKSGVKHFTAQETILTICFILTTKWIRQLYTE